MQNIKHVVWLLVFLNETAAEGALSEMGTLLWLLFALGANFTLMPVAASLLEKTAATKGLT